MELSDHLATALFPKSRRAVLALLYGQPDSMFYLREIVSRTRLGVGQVQRELARLSDAGILFRKERGRHVYFGANPDCPIFDELRSLTSKTMGASTALRAVLAPLTSKIAAAFIHGSVARGEERVGSDIDIFVVGEVSFAELSAAAGDAEKVINRPVNISVYRPREFQRKLAAGNHFLRTVMREKKEFVVGGEDELGELQGERVDS